MTFEYASIKDIKNEMPNIIRLKVSQRAREPNQFLHNYLIYRNQLPMNWQIKRENFIKRTLPAYNKNPTERRRLALLVWAFKVTK